MAYPQASLSTDLARDFSSLSFSLTAYTWPSISKGHVMTESLTEGHECVHPKAPW